MSDEKMVEMLNAIGQHLADIVGEHPDGTYLYAEVTAGSCGAGVFKDMGNEVRYYDPSLELDEELFDLWHAAAPNEKWAVLHYEVKDGQFDARFTYPDEVDLDDIDTDWRERALIERYGNKPVIYPEPDERFHELTEADLAHLDDPED